MHSVIRKLVSPLTRAIRGVISFWRYKDAVKIKIALHMRLQELLKKHHPRIRVKLYRWQWVVLHGVHWGGCFTVLAYLDGICYCGMSFDLIGPYLIITQIHGVRLNTCRYRLMRRYWEVTLVRAANDLGYKTLLIRADHCNGWQWQNEEVRQRLIKRNDETALALGMTKGRVFWRK